MNIIFDIGNTRTKVAVFENGKIIENKIFTDIQICDVELVLRQHLSIKNCIISCTGKLENELFGFLQSNFNNLIQLSGESKLPFNNNYESKNTQGADRIAAVAGAQVIYPNSDVLIIDAGTALTFDFIDAEGNYKGGSISVGIQSRFKALHNFTSKLPLLSQSENFSLLANNTQQAIISGVQNGVIFEIDSYINQLKIYYPQLKTIITGGDADFLANKLKNIIFVDLNLVLKGLNRILEYNAV